MGTPRIELTSMMKKTIVGHAMMKMRVVKRSHGHEGLKLRNPFQDNASQSLTTHTRRVYVMGFSIFLFYLNQKKKQPMIF